MGRVKGGKEEGEGLVCGLECGGKRYPARRRFDADGPESGAALRLSPHSKMRGGRWLLGARPFPPSPRLRAFAALR